MFVLGVPAYRQRFRSDVSAPTRERFHRPLRACCAAAEQLREPFSGTVECDETTFGGARHGKRGWGGAGKVFVLARVQRHGHVKAIPYRPAAKPRSEADSGAFRLPLDCPRGERAAPWPAWGRQNSPGSITSNRTVSEWRIVFGDAAAATAILDRLLHHSPGNTIRGETYRFKGRRRAGVLSQPNPGHIYQPLTSTHRGINSECRRGSIPGVA